MTLVMTALVAGAVYLRRGLQAIGLDRIDWRIP